MGKILSNHPEQRTIPLSLPLHAEYTASTITKEEIVQAEKRWKIRNYLDQMAYMPTK
jgi:hypothetical protein